MCVKLFLPCMVYVVSVCIYVKLLVIVYYFHVLSISKGGMCCLL